MASRRKGPIRQLSLQLNSPPSRPTLKKQASVTNDLSSKIVVKRPIRLAWADGETNVEIVAKRCTEQQKTNSTNPVQSIRHSFVEKETILYTRQELAERLRKAWKEREESKKGIDIFLAQNTVLSDPTYGGESTDRSSQSENSELKSTQIYDNETSFSKPVMPNELYLKTFKDSNSGTDEDNKLCGYVPSNTKTSISRDMAQISIIIANKTIKETKEIKSNAQNDCQITDETSTWSQDHSHPTDDEFDHDKQTNDDPNEHDLETEKQTSVVNKPTKVKPSKELNCDIVETELTTGNTEKHLNDKPSIGCNNVVITPISASAKRERFQRSATNKEFSGTITDKPLNRPPLIRASSVPLNENKNKVVVSKRRLKTAPSTRRRVADDRPPSGSNKNGKKNGKKDDKRNGQMARSASAAGGDIVTMVSLTSPAQSDAEDEVSKKTVGTKKTPNEITEPLKMSSLRKTIKSVSFHQSTLSGARSYSASFPLRRVSLAPPSFANINALFASYSSNPQQSTSEQHPAKIATTPLTEKLSENVTGATYNDLKTNNNTNSGGGKNIVVQQQETRGLKRRLVRMKSAQSFENLAVDPLTSTDRKNNQESQASGNATDVKKQFPTDDNMQCQENVPPTTEECSDEAGNDAPKFNSSKEKQCWNMYKKMCEKGVTVSFDTILKGMLTPTEYRLRSKDLQTMITSENDDTS